MEFEFTSLLLAALAFSVVATFLEGSRELGFPSDSDRYVSECRVTNPYAAAAGL